MLPKFNINSPKHLSLLLFGGTIIVDSLEPMYENGEVVRFKTGAHKGEIRFKKVSTAVNVKGLGLNPLDSWKTKAEGVYQVNEKVLKLIAGIKEDDN